MAGIKFDKDPVSAGPGKNDKQLALGFLESMTLQMFGKGKSDEELLAFVNDPSAKVLGLTDIDPVRDWFYWFIQTHTTPQERYEILSKLESENKLTR